MCFLRKSSDDHCHAKLSVRSPNSVTPVFYHWKNILTVKMCILINVFINIKHLYEDLTVINKVKHSYSNMSLKMCWAAQSDSTTAASTHPDFLQCTNKLRDLPALCLQPFPLISPLFISHLGGEASRCGTKLKIESTKSRFPLLNYFRKMRCLFSATWVFLTLFLSSGAGQWEDRSVSLIVGTLKIGNLTLKSAK